MIDLYVGALERYYSGQWESQGHRVLREQGLKPITTYGVPQQDEIRLALDGAKEIIGSPPWIDRANAKCRIAPWIAGVGSGKGLEPIVIDEAFDEYWTDQFPERIRDALVVFVAHLCRPDLPMPANLTEPKYSYAAVAEAGAKGYLGNIAVFDADIYLPSLASRSWLETDILKRRVIASTTGALRQLLDEVNSRCWRADAGEQESWYRSSDGSLQSAAKDAWIRLSNALAYAGPRNLAIVVDK